MRTQSICLAVAIVLICSFASAQWVQTSLHSGTIRCIADSGTSLFAGKDYYGVLLSTDNGTSWTAVGLTGTRVFALAFSSTNAFAGTDSGVFRSTNNGTTWTAVNTGLAYPYVKALAVKDTLLFAGGLGVSVSSNNGTNWTAAGLTNTEVRALVVSDTFLFAGTYGGDVFLSTNDGSSWTTVSTGLTNATVSAFVVNGRNLFAGTDSGVFRSTNNGTTWTAVDSGFPNNIPVHALAVCGNNLMAGTQGWGAFLSTNNGTSWTAVNTGLTYWMVGALKAFGTHLFAGTEGGGVWRRLLSDMITAVEPTTSALPHEFALAQNYPNPFNPVTTITFAIPKQGAGVGTLHATSLQVFDPLGRHVATLVNEPKEPGVYTVQWDATGVSSGVYFYRIKAGDFVQTKRMMVVR